VVNCTAADVAADDVLQAELEHLVVGQQDLRSEAARRTMSVEDACLPPAEEDCWSPET
jgi:hypothetical protein